MARRTGVAEVKTERVVAIGKRAPAHPVPPLVLPAHLKPLTGPTGPKPSY